MDVKALTAALFKQVHEYVAPALATVRKEIADVDAKIKEIPAGEKGDPGESGKDGSDGEQGPQGERGEQGQAGEPGTPGKDGAEGAPGPSGRDGVDGKSFDPQTLTDAIEEGVSKALPAAVQKALDEVMPDLVIKVAAVVPRPRDGVDGTSPDEAEIVAKLTEKMLRAVDALPKPEAGRDGRDAPAVDLDAVVAKVMPLIPVPRDGKDAGPIDFDAVVEKATALIPVPRNGVDGRDAAEVDVDAVVETVMKRLPEVKDGRDGVDGRSVDIDDVVAKTIALIRVPSDGVDGKSVTLDDIKPIVDAATAQWQLEFERSASAVMRGEIEKAIASIPAPVNGVDGRDAMALENFDAALDGRMLTLSFRAGDQVITRVLKLPIPLDKGVYRSGTTYDQSDTVTYGGSGWIALRETKTKPPSDDWRLQVRRGADGKDAERPS